MNHSRIYRWTGAARISVLWLVWTETGWRWVDPLSNS